MNDIYFEYSIWPGLHILNDAYYDELLKFVSIRYEELKIYSRAIVIFRVTLNYFELLVILLHRGFRNRWIEGKY